MIRARSRLDTVPRGRKRSATILLWDAIRFSGDSGHGRRFGAVLQVRGVARSVPVGRDHAVHRGQLRPGLPVGRLLPGHPGDAGQVSQQGAGTRVRLPRLRAQHYRMRHCAERPRARGLLLITAASRTSPFWQSLWTNTILLYAILSCCDNKRIVTDAAFGPKSSVSQPIFENRLFKKKYTYLFF